jgi:hypothetical protein
MKVLHIAFDGRCLSAWWEDNIPTQSIKNKRVVIAMNIPDYYIDRCQGSQKEVIQYLKEMSIIPDIQFETQSLPVDYASKGIELAMKKKSKSRAVKPTPEGGLFSDEHVGKVEHHPWGSGQ